VCTPRAHTHTHSLSLSRTHALTHSHNKHGNLFAFDLNRCARGRGYGGQGRKAGFLGNWGVAAGRCETRERCHPRRRPRAWLWLWRCLPELKFVEGILPAACCYVGGGPSSGAASPTGKRRTRCGISWSIHIHMYIISSRIWVSYVVAGISFPAIIDRLAMKVLLSLRTLFSAHCDSTGPTAHDDCGGSGAGAVAG
jgi:hypothetical protein